MKVTIQQKLAMAALGSATLLFIACGSGSVTDPDSDYSAEVSKVMLETTLANATVIDSMMTECANGTVKCTEGGDTKVPSSSSTDASSAAAASSSSDVASTSSSSTAALPSSSSTASTASSSSVKAPSSSSAAVVSSSSAAVVSSSSAASSSSVASSSSTGGSSTSQEGCTCDKNCSSVINAGASQNTTAESCYFVPGSYGIINLGATAEINGTEYSGYTTNLPAKVDNGYYVYTPTAIWFGIQ